MKRLCRIASIALALVTILLCCSACAPRDKDVMGACGGYDILYQELRFQALDYRDKHPDCTEAEAWSGVEQALLRQYAILALCSDYLPGRSIDSPEMQDWAKQEWKDSVESVGGKKEFNARMKESHLTRDHFLRMLCMTQLQLELETALFAATELKDDATLTAWLDDGNYARVIPVVFPTEEFTRTEVQFLAGLITAGASLEDLLGESYTQKGAKIQNATYYFRGMQNSPLEAAALSLEELGDVSDVVEDGENYIILIRTDNDRDALITYQLSTVLRKYRSNRLDALIEEKLPSMQITWTDAAKELSLLSLK